MAELLSLRLRGPLLLLLFLAAAAPPPAAALPPPQQLSNCTAPPFAHFPFCNASLPLSARVADLVARLTPEDLQGLLSNGNAGIPRLGVPQITYGEALHGALTRCGAASDPSSTGCATSFPHPLALASTLNRTLWAAIAGAIATESRGLHNQGGLQASIVWAPNANLFRDPRWGRGGETSGEDPLVTSIYAATFVSAMQEGEDPRYLKVPVSIKHVYGYDFESSDGLARNFFNAIISERDLVDYFFRPFKAAVQDARVSGCMCSYVAVNFVPNCADRFFFNSVMRGQWGFDGTVVTDCGAVRELWNSHFYAPDNISAVADAIHGGVDYECGSFFNSYIVEALGAGKIALADLQQAATRMLGTAFRAGLFDDPASQPYTRIDASSVDTALHRQLAFDAATQAAVLLKNDVANATWGRFLPLLPLQSAALRGRRIAIIGPNANATQTLLSNYHGENTLVNSQSILAALQRRGVADGFEVTFAVGCWSPSCTSSEGFAAASEAAAVADVVLVVLGTCSDDCPLGDAGGATETEGTDRKSTDLPGLQDALLQAVVAAAGPAMVPVCLILVHAGPLSVDFAARSSGVPAILDAHFPGQAGGDAVVGLLFGDASPSGRTTMTIYASSFNKERPLVIDTELAPHVDVFGEQVAGVTHLFYNTSEPLWRFGSGLSYANFSFMWRDGTASPRFSFDAEALPPSFSVNVTNNGPVVSDVSAIALWSSGVPGEPLEECFDFQREAAVRVGETREMVFTLPPDVMAVASRDGVLALMPGAGNRVRIGDPSRGGSTVEADVTLTGPGVELFNLPRLRREA